MPLSIDHPAEIEEQAQDIAERVESAAQTSNWRAYSLASAEDPSASVRDYLLRFARDVQALRTIAQGYPDAEPLHELAERAGLLMRDVRSAFYGMYAASMVAADRLDKIVHRQVLLRKFIPNWAK